jgi:hypothetical protein
VFEKKMALPTVIRRYLALIGVDTVGPGGANFVEDEQENEEEEDRICASADGQKEPESLPFAYRFLTNFVVGEVGTRGGGVGTERLGTWLG